MTKPALIKTNVSAKLHVDVQFALDEPEHTEPEEPPSLKQLTEWANTAYAMSGIDVGEQESELTIRLVGVDEIINLNRQYRHKDKSTNVLSFAVEPFASLDTIQELNCALLGDIVICHAVIVNEARDQHKTVDHHYAHMVVHGVLHLCGYDHQNEKTAEQMETLETKILAQFSITNPYNEH